MSVPQPAPVRPEDLGEDGYAWRRMHPVTPLLKGWKTVAAILIIVSTQLTDDIRRSAAPPRRRRTEGCRFPQRRRGQRP